MTPEVTGLDDYFPERALARWLAANDLPSTVYAFPRLGVQTLRAAYRELVDHLGVDAIVNPLMAMYFSFDLGGLAGRSLYLDRLENTYGMRQVASRIEEFRAETDPRLPRAFPH